MNSSFTQRWKANLSYASFFFIVIAQLMAITNALNKVPINQYTSFMPYNLTNGRGNLHAYFDVGYGIQNNLIQADDNATYYFSKVCKQLINLNSFSLPECR